MLRRLLLTAAFVVVSATAAVALEADLSWTNPVIPGGSPAPTSILVEKAPAVSGPFTTLHSLAPTATTDIDTTVALGVPACYRLTWIYPLGPSPALGPQCATPAVGPAGTLLNIQFK